MRSTARFLAAALLGTTLVMALILALTAVPARASEIIVHAVFI